MSIVTDYLDSPVRAQADNTLANAELVVNIIIIFLYFMYGNIWPSCTFHINNIEIYDHCWMLKSTSPYGYARLISDSESAYIAHT